MGSAFESVENSAFVDRIKWSRKTYALRMLLGFRQPPCIVSIAEGHRGSNDVENLPPGLIVRIHSVFAERRVFARCVDGKVFSIPETFPIKFEVVKKNGKRSKARRLDEILRDYRPPLVVVLDRKNNRWAFRNGKLIQSEDTLGTLSLFKAYFEHFARVNQLIDGAIDRRVFLIPLYMDIDVRLAEGLNNENNTDFTVLMDMYGRAVESIDYSAYSSLNAILQFDPSAGSIHPLAASRLQSRANSMPGVNFFSDSRTVTGVPTLEEIRSSLASGSQGQVATVRSAEVPRQRGRAHSESFLRTLTTERGDNRLAVKSGVKDTKGSIDISASGGSIGQELELMRQTGREAQMSRRKGRSAEELQTMPMRNDVSLEAVSLSRLPEASQTTTSQRSEVQNVHHLKENQKSKRKTTGREERTRNGANLEAVAVNRLPNASHATISRRTEVQDLHHPKGNQKSNRKGTRQEEGSRTGNGANQKAVSLERISDASQATISRRSEVQNVRHLKEYEKDSRKGTGRHEGQAVGHATLMSNRSRSRNPVLTTPTPKPRTSRSRKQSEDSSQSVAPTPNGELDRRGRSYDRSISLNPSQGWSTSPAPNYHIHINIQSPNSTPGQQWSTLSGPDVHSAAPPTAAITGAPPLLDNGYFDATPFDESVRQTLARQEFRPQVLPHPVSYTYLRHESSEPKLTDTRRHIHVMQETYPPKVTESVRHAQVRHVIQQPKITETEKPTYVRQETYPRENLRWNSNPMRGFFHDVVPTMYRSAPFERRSTSGRIFVSTVSCTGSGSFDRQPKNDFANEGHGSHRLCSKVIRLKNGDDSEISEMEVKEFYGRTSTIRSTGSYIKPYVEIGDANNNSTLSSGKHHHQLVNYSVRSDKRSNPRSNKGSDRNIKVPFTVDRTKGVHQTTKSRPQDTPTEADSRRTRDAPRSSRWILRSGIQNPDDRSDAPRQVIGTTIAV